MKAVLVSLLLVAVPMLALVQLASACPDPDFGCDPVPGIHPGPLPVPHVTQCTEVTAPAQCGYNLVCVGVDASERCVRDPCGPPTVCTLDP